MENPLKAVFPKNKRLVLSYCWLCNPRNWFGYFANSQQYVQSFRFEQKIPNTLKDQVNTVDALRFRDTDRDGLRIFDELYVYGTSPYIPDSDSDGDLDGEEIKLGKPIRCAPVRIDC